MSCAVDVLNLSRIQFALNSGFHFLYPPMSIGLGLMLVIMEGLYLKTRDIRYKEITQFWIKIFSLTFALGVATGLVQTFAFGTNWARYSRFVGDVFGSALAAEGVFAFFLEAGFLGILLFGWEKVGAKLHYFSTVCVALGAHFSAVWIIVANSWMQTPTAYKIVESPTGPRAAITEFWAMVFNPSSMDRLIHVLLGCWVTGSFFVISVAAYYLLRKRHVALARPMMKIGLTVGLASLVLQLFSGDSSADIVAKYQPSKLAAIEGVYRTVPYTPISVLGWVDGKNEEVHSLAIPGALSFLVNNDPAIPVKGLDQIPREDWPNVPLVFQTYHIMVLTWGIMFLIAFFGVWFWRKGNLETKRWMLWPMVFAVVLPHLAQQTGWITAEAGRQPWIVWNVLRTSDGVSTSIATEQVAGSIGMFVVIYLLLFALFLFLLDRKIKHGPEEVVTSPGDLIYRDIYKQ